jgi:hypothetical protein
MNTKLAMVITMEELRIATNVMTRGKYLGPNGMVVETYTFFWDLMGEEYFQMIKIVVELAHLQKGQQKLGHFFI